MNENWVKRLKYELQQPLPGTEAQLKMSPLVSRPVATDKPLKKSAVLILLYPFDKQIFTVFIKRTEYQGVHSGQISLPGGIFKKSDIDLSNTALRETMEETGIPADQIEIIGKLTYLHIPVSNISVYPFVALFRNRPEFHPDSFEVQYLIETSLDEFFNPLNRKLKDMTFGTYGLEVPYYDIRDNHIWGATAMIMSEFLEVVKRI